jgi:MinD superfamily P-loop ATPase
MKELVVISGKGGTGKTSIVAALAALAGNAVLADCDVDAADLYLIMQPKVLYQEDFLAGSRAEIKVKQCSSCGLCFDLCRFQAIQCNGAESSTNDCCYRVDPLSCEGCGVCAYVCPDRAIEMKTPVCGEWYISDTRYGPMIHARLGIAEENSGKLVTLVRNQAKKLAEESRNDLIIVDGPPGIGCPVISSLTGADLVLAVTEPTIAGEHDLLRLGELTSHFDIPTVVCINKWDINPDRALEIEKAASDQNMKVIGRIHYDDVFTKAQIEGISVVQYSDNGVVAEVRSLWDRLVNELERSR